MNDLIKKLESQDDLSKEEMARLLDTTDAETGKALLEAAYRAKVDNVGKNVYFRGIVEFSNRCIKDCNYCGIRRSNKEVERFQMTEDEIVEAAVWAWEAEYASIVLQSGERQDDAFTDFVESVLKRIEKETKGELRVTLSLGEQTVDTFRKWYDAGARRYLLRIESSNRELYTSLHPEDHDFEQRKKCLNDLREIGYQVGTGVMIGLPGQTSEDLVNDILFFKEMDIDMIGMGPYLVHSQTPMAENAGDFDADRQLELGLRMIALTRLTLPDVNIAATTALQALDHAGRERGLEAGANVIMPNITDTKYRESYQLYEGKPCMDENATMCRGCLSRRVDSVGESIAFGRWGDAPHFTKRTKDEVQKV